MDMQLAHLIVLDIAVGLISLGATMAGLIYLGKLLGEARASTEAARASTERIAASMGRIVEIIDRDLGEIKDLLRGQ